MKTHTLKTGDILYTSWGYDQTNIDFYQVVEVVGKASVRIRGIQSRVVGNSHCSNTVVPDKDNFPGYAPFLEGNMPTLKRVKPGNTLSMSSYANAYPWEGQELYETAYGYGH